MDALRKSMEVKRRSYEAHQLEAYNEARDSVTVKANQIPLCEGTVVSIVESIKFDLLEKDYYGREIQNGLKNIVAEEALLDALQQIVRVVLRFDSSIM